MKLFVLRFRPTPDQLEQIGDDCLLDSQVFPGYEGCYLISFDEDTYDLPGWLEGQDEVNIPGMKI